MLGMPAVTEDASHSVGIPEVRVEVGAQQLKWVRSFTSSDTCTPHRATEPNPSP